MARGYEWQHGQHVCELACIVKSAQAATAALGAVSEARWTTRSSSSRRPPSPCILLGSGGVELLSRCVRVRESPAVWILLWALSDFLMHGLQRKEIKKYRFWQNMCFTCTRMTTEDVWRLLSSTEEDDDVVGGDGGSLGYSRADVCEVCSNPHETLSPTESLCPLFVSSFILCTCTRSVENYVLWKLIHLLLSENNILGTIILSHTGWAWHCGMCIKTDCNTGSRAGGCGCA